MRNIHILTLFIVSSFLSANSYAFTNYKKSLHTAIKDGDLAKVEKLIKKKPKLLKSQLQSDSGKTPSAIFVSAKYSYKPKSADIFELLVNSGADIHTQYAEDNFVRQKMSIADYVASKTSFGRDKVLERNLQALANEGVQISPDFFHKQGPEIGKYSGDKVRVLHKFGADCHSSYLYYFINETNSSGLKEMLKHTSADFGPNPVESLSNYKISTLNAEFSEMAVLSKIEKFNYVINVLSTQLEFSDAEKETILTAWSTHLITTLSKEEARRVNDAIREKWGKRTDRVIKILKFVVVTSWRAGLL